MQSIRAKIQDANSELFNHLHQINAQKLGQLIGPQIISDSSPENFKTVVGSVIYTCREALKIET